MWRFSSNSALALAAAAVLAGCTVPGIHTTSPGSYPERNEVPIAVNFKTSTQLKLQAAEHWRLAANASAAELLKSFRPGTTLHLRRSCETTGCQPRACDTTFNRVFFNEFLTALVGLGYPVSATPAANAAVVEIDVQAVRFSANRPQYRYAGAPVEIGPGIWALRDVSSLVDGQGVVALRTDGHNANWYRTEFAAGATPRTELVITVSALSAQQTYLARNTTVYYTADGDAAHYYCGPAAGASRTWTIPVTGDCTAPRCVEPDRRR